MEVRFLGLFSWLILMGLTLGGWTLIPAPTPYPHKPPADVRAEADALSSRLAEYIEAWLAGKAPAQIPAALIPTGVQDNKQFRLARPQEVSSQALWVTRLAKPINLAAVQNGLPDPNVTYLFLKTPLAPFGHRLVVRGAFPHARFFGFQITPPIDGVGYYPARYFGSAEVPLSDVDIEPLPGHTNPYRVGSHRDATKRGYQVTFLLATGDPVALNPSFRPPYRGAGNLRTGSMFIYQGPWGVKAPYGLKFGVGPWELGSLWVRVYAPEGDALGGVPLPDAWFETPKGERYVVLSDASRFEARAHATMSARKTFSTWPRTWEGPTVGWRKSYGILLSLLEASSEVNGWLTPALKKQITEVDLGATGRGPDAPAPHHYEPHATTATHNAYLGRSMALPRGRVCVLTGRMPTFPDTRQGLKTMVSAQVRYWSIVGYDNDLFAKLPGSAINAVADDEVVLDASRHYVIVYSRPEDRPRNATVTNGVTWVNWGPTTRLGLMMRWMTVRPEWSFRQSPDELNLPWHTGALSSPTYDVSLIGQNSFEGFMGEYLPRVHYLTRQAFESLGPKLRYHQIPVWQ